MEMKVLEMMGALEDNTGYNEVQDAENPLPSEQELAQTLQMGEPGASQMIEPDVDVGRNAVKKMEDLQMIGGLQS